ncbi:EYxxD motif small membrane protein [Neobacillus fumarioli]
MYQYLEYVTDTSFVIALVIGGIVATYYALASRTRRRAR